MVKSVKGKFYKKGAKMKENEIIPVFTGTSLPLRKQGRE